MIAKQTIEGKIDASEPARVLLYNFAIGHAEPKPQHCGYLLQNVIPRLNGGGSVSIVGLASRTGSSERNDRLSVARAHQVLRFLRGKASKQFNVREFKAFGERKAAYDGQRDGVEDEHYRAVVLYLAPGPNPPDPKLGPEAILQELPSQVTHNETYDTWSRRADSAGQILDIASGGASVVNLFVTSFVLATIIDVTATMLTIVSAIISLPAVWLSGQRLAQKNGGIRGFSEAMQKMADVFSDYDLCKVPESKWPAIPHLKPTNLLPDEAVTVAERCANIGMREGYEEAWKLVQKLEASPKDMEVSTNGKKSLISVSGGRFLWFLSQAYSDDVKTRMKALLELK